MMTASDVLEVLARLEATGLTGLGREVDLHPVTPTADGGGDQALPGGGTLPRLAGTASCPMRIGWWDVASQMPTMASSRPDRMAFVNV
jgi:hypothetical protein